MTDDEKQLLIAQAKEIATFGFEHGFKQAIDFIDGIAEQGNSPESRRAAQIMVVTLKQVLQDMLPDVPDMFTFQVLTGEDGSPKMTFH